MRDWEIRKLLKERILPSIVDTTLPSIVINEMEVCRGDGRVDVAVVNGAMTGYEIKGSFDDLRRLRSQIATYSRVLDSISVVVCQEHLADVQTQIPQWCGIITVGSSIDDAFKIVRHPADNPSIDPLSVASLLWRDEALSVLATRGLDSGIRSKPREVLWERLVSSLSLPELKQEVRNKLKAREGWRSDSPQMSDDDLFPLFST